MESVRKALWLLESRFRGGVSLGELSVVTGISRHHFAHVFAGATGQSAMRYMRGRRLSEAARVLANGGADWTCPAFVESVFDFTLPALRTEAG